MERKNYVAAAATFLLAAVGRPRRKACIAPNFIEYESMAVKINEPRRKKKAYLSVYMHILAADQLVLVIAERKISEAGLHAIRVAAPEAAAEAEREVQRRSLADAVVGQCSALLLI
jgi:hypothetical protein